MIRFDKHKDKYILYTHDGSRVLGTHNTYKEALRQERAIQWSKHHRSNPLTMSDRRGPMQFYDFINNQGEHVGQGDYEIIPNAEVLSKWSHAPLGEDFDNLKRIVGQDYPIGVVVDILISRLHRGKGYGKQILEETIRHMIEEEGVQSVLLIVEIEPEEPFDLVEWYTREGFEDLGFTTRYRYPLMILR